MQKKVTPFLWFDTEAEEAMNLYVSLFKNSKVIDVQRKDGAVFSVVFELDGQEFCAFNAGPMFKFTEATSFFVDCEDQAEVDYFWNGFISAGGEESMCGWLKDKWGLSWQIVPKALMRGLEHEDPVKAKAVVDAMMEMRKIDVAVIEKAME
jgi:predicted 3-demethylubiquinone-9 3-methyltransferase (glyoxalase superfamily)